MANNLNPILTGRGRVFINENGSGCGNAYGFHNCMKVDSLEKSLGDITSIYCPDSNTYDEFVEVAAIKGTDSRWTSTLSGRIAVDAESALERILRRGCNFDLQVHYGACTRPDDFNNFDTSFIFRDVRLTSYSLDTLVAISPDERNAVTESAAISIGEVYRVFNPTFSQVGQSVLTVGVGAGLAICDIKSCGTDCNPTSNGCDKIYVLNVPNVSAPANIIFSEDAGLTWQSSTTNSVNVNGTEEIADILCVGDTLYLTLQDGTSSFVYTILADNVDVTGSTLTQIYTTTEDLRTLDLGIDYVFACGGDGDSFVIGINKDSGTVTVLDDGVITPSSGGLSVDAFDDDNVLIGLGVSIR